MWSGELTPEIVRKRVRAPLSAFSFLL